MKPKQTTSNNDPLASLRAIDQGQAAAPITDKDGKTVTPPQPKPQTRTIDPGVESKKWASRYEIAKTYQLPLFQKWGSWYDAMYAHVNNPQMAPWRSKVYMPIIASKVWDLIARFIQYRPGWDVSIRTLPINTLDKATFDLYMDAMSKNVEKVKMKLDYDYDCPLMDDSIKDELLGVMLDAAVTGQGVARVPYLNRNASYKQYVNNGGSMDYSKIQNTQAQEGYNALQGVNIFNFFLKPGAKSLQKSPWVIVSDQVPLYELQNDPKIDQTALQKVKVNGLTNEFAQYEAARNRLITTQDSSNLDTTTDMVQRFECWDKQFNETVIYAIGDGGWVELYRGTNVYWHQKYPLVPFYIRRKPYQFWGESLFENSETLQAAINDIFNHFMDGYNMADGMVAIEEGSVVEPYVIEPGGEIRYRGEMPKQFKFPQPDAAGMQTALNLINGSIENATISQYASGVPNSQTDSTQGTATGVTRMMEAAAEKVGMMRSNFRNSWREVGQMWVSNSQQFMQTNIVHQTTVKGKQQYDIIHPEDLLGIFGVRVDDGSFEPISKDQKRQDYLTFISNLQAWQQSSLQQAQVTQTPTDAVRLDWNEIVMRGAEQFGEAASHFVLPVVPPQQGQPTAPDAENPQENAAEGGVEEPTDTAAAAAPAAAQPPLPASAVMGQPKTATQADGRSLPSSFPIRSVNSPALGG